MSSLVNPAIADTTSGTTFRTKKGNARAGIVSKGANYTLQNSDDIVIFTASGLTFQVPPSPVIGQKHTFISKLTAAGTLNINPNGATIFQGTNSTAVTTTVNIGTAFQGIVSMIWDGGAWYLGFGW